MTVTERHALEALRDPVLNNAADGHVGDDYESDGYGEMVLDGTEALDVSHAGGEFQELTRGLLGDFWNSTSEEARGKRPDYRTFRDRSTIQTAAFSVQMGAMAEAYMMWSFKHSGTGGKGFFDSDERRTREEQTRSCDGVDTKLLTVLVLDVFPLVRHGLIPCSPITPKAAVTVHALHLYHTARQRCPHLSIQGYVKSLCDMHGDEPEMRFAMLFAQDGNDSLKRVATRILDGDIDHVAASPTSERTFHHEQYLTQRQRGHSIVDEDGDGNLCAERWKNMKDNATQKMWNVFDESGVFIAVCRHGFCLLIADMVQSGEQSVDQYER
ncbi:hypothetical protein EDD15DRAFT_2201864 [Pisolithus albus]|nr:hypothetical protein EDD15DRAFT_2201856 [Pisolithus albus]KAI5983708.1 hypothetical protein EDD15DRAFT_2201864 [Pisolithus albus]